MPVKVTPDEVERVRPNKISENSSELTYLNKDVDADMSAYDRVLYSLKKLDTLYNPTMHKMHNPFIEGNYKVTGDTRVIPIVEHKDDEIQWACSTSISTGAGEPDTLKEVMTMPNGYLYKISEISEVNHFLSRKAWIPTKISVVKSKGRKPVPVKWVFKSKEEADGLIILELINLVKGYMQVPVVDFT